MEVKDNGIGIRPDSISKVFAMFKRAHTEVQNAGAGVGLALCSKIIERHHGDMGVTSESGKGSTFWFTIPLYRPEKELTAQEKLLKQVAFD